MKLRLKGNSLRLRLGQSEVARLRDGGILEEATVFGPLGGQRLLYTLSIANAGQSISASFDGGRVHVHIPSDMVRRWAGSDDMSVSGSQPTGDGRSLHILVEKDLECLDPSASAGESQADTFPHPQPSALCGKASGR